MAVRPVNRLTMSKPTIEGAGVRLRRAFGFGGTSEFDPFLLLDDFRNDVPENYLAGFPWHPHRGIETITYMLAGTVEHGDSMGNRGVIGPGDVQWMTAGSGIIHQEMPKGDATGRMQGFQLWSNLPSRLKMTAPRYQEIKSEDIPDIGEADGTRVRLICGNYGGMKGPVDSIAADPSYLDVSVSSGRNRRFPVESAHHVFAYVISGSGGFGPEAGAVAENRTLVLFGDGDEVAVQAGNDGIRFLLVWGEPLREPVAWKGPIVMNTQEELRKAFEELEEGTFLKH